MGLLAPLAILIFLFLMGSTLLKNSNLLLWGIAAFFFINFIIFILLFKDSDYPNKYGPSEKYPNGAASNPMMDN